MISVHNFRRLLAYYLVMGYQPLTAVEDDGFRLFAQTIQPDLQIPSADTMTRFVKKEFEAEYSEVKRKFAIIESKLSLTIDCWTSSSMKAFFGVTAHWISNWNMHECTVDFADISDISHTGANLANVLTKIIEDLGVQNKVLAVVADNASNNDTLFLNIQQHTHIEQVRCFGHVLNLVVQEALGHISECITLLRELLKKVKYSSQKQDMLMKLCNLSDISKAKPLLDISTRWSSTYAMINQAIDIRNVCFFFFFSRYFRRENF
jgi:Protein of unknown function (DUF 659)